MGNWSRYGIRTRVPQALGVGNIHITMHILFILALNLPINPSYERVDELIWVKTNQLQRIIRTGRTGHWLNHGKEHCLVGMKGNPKNLNRGLDCDVIVAEVRATSHKPDEIYGIIERLSPGTRKIELFGRPHNVQPNWITLGNQLDGIRLVDPELITQFQKRYPDGNCMSPAAAAGPAGSITNPPSAAKK